jgi:HSP20 family protein
MARKSDPFAGFDRLRTEIDELFGDLWQGPAPARPRVSGFSPRVDVYYCGDPPKAIVKADLSGVNLEGISLEISGRALVISGERPVQETEGRVYQQVEIATGPFRRIVELSADVDAGGARATYEDGILRVELPLVRPTEHARHVPVERSERGEP